MRREALVAGGSSSPLNTGWIVGLFRLGARSARTVLLAGSTAWQRGGAFRSRRPTQRSVTRRASDNTVIGVSLQVTLRASIGVS